MDNMMAFGVVLSLVDSFSKPLGEISKSVSTLNGKLNTIETNKATKELQELEERAKKLNSLKIKLNNKLKDSWNEAKKLNKTIREIDTKVDSLNKQKLTLKKELKSGKIDANKFKNEIEKIDKSINSLNSQKLNLKEKLKSADQSAIKVNSDIKRVSKQIDRLNSKKLKINSELEKTALKAQKANSRLKELSLSVAKYSAFATATGKMGLDKITSFVSEFKEIQKAQGDIATLGIDENGIKEVTKAAKKMSSEYAQVTVPDFIKASYDIKSGISSLSDEGVAKYTSFATLTARATKSTVDEMTKLYALGYEIFKNKDENDFDFGKRFGASISKAVKAFRTDGSDLVLGISNIGAMAKKMGVSLEQELAVIGNAKGAFNSAAEAGTAYRAFLSGAVKAQEKLSLSFLDTKGNLLPMVKILEQIKTKFGKSLDAKEMNQLKEAFGSEEAVKMITALIDKTNELKKSEQEIIDATFSEVEKMAKDRNKGQEFTLLTQNLKLLSATVGEVFAPYMDMATNALAKFAKWARELIEGNSFVKTLLLWGGALVLFATALGGVGLGISAFLAAVAFANKGLIFFSTITRTVAATIWLLNSALTLLTSPITLVVIAFIGAVYLIYKYWDELAKWFTSFWSGLVEIFSSSIEWIILLFTNPVEAISKAWTFLVNWFASFLGTIGEIFVDGIRYIANIFIDPIGFIKRAWGELLLWIDKKLNSIKSVINSVSKFLGLNKVFDVSIDKDTTELKDIKFYSASSKDKTKYDLEPLKLLKESITPIAKNTKKIAQGAKDIKIAPFIPKEKGKLKRATKKLRGDKNVNERSITPSSPSSYSTNIGSKSSGNTYNINIKIAGNSENEIANKLTAILPNMIKDLEENILGRAMYDL